MPQVPVYAQQMQTPTGPGLPQASPADFGGAVGQAFQVAGQVAGQMEARADRRDDEVAAVGASKTASEANLYWTQQMQDRKAAAQPGDQTFIPTLMKDFDQYASDTLAKADDPKVQKYLAYQLNGLRTHIGDQAIGFQAEQNATQQVADMTSANNLDENTLQGDPTRFDAVLGNAVGRINATSLPAAEKAQYINHVTNGLSKSAVIGEINQDPYAAKDALDKGTWDPYLSGEDKSVLYNHAQVRINQLEAQARQAQSEKNQALAERLKDFEASLEAGVPMDSGQVQQMSNLAGAINRPELARHIAILGRANDLTQNAQLQTPVDLQRQIGEVDDRINRDGPNASAQDFLDRKTLGAVLARQQTELPKDPLAYASHAGVTSVAPVYLNDPDSMAQRRQTAHGVASYFGVPPKFLTQEESADLKTKFQQADPDGKLGLVQNIAQGFGNDAQSVLSTVGEKDPVFAHAAGLSLLGPEQRSAARQIFVGQQIVAAGNKVLPSPEKINSAALTGLGSALALRPGDRAAVISSAKYIYAAEAQRQGLDPQTIDEATWSKSLNQAMGATGIGTDQQQGGLHTPGTVGLAGFWRGNRNPIVLPPNMTAQQFDDTWYGLSDQDLKTASVGGAAPHYENNEPIPAAALRDGYLFDAGNGLYAVSMDKNGSQFVHGSGPNGWYVLDINKARQAAIGRARKSP